jgi:hypothetical protein
VALSQPLSTHAGMMLLLMVVLLFTAFFIQVHQSRVEPAKA